MGTISMRWAKFVVWYGPQIVRWGRGLAVWITVGISLWALVDMGRAIFSTSLLSVRVVPDRTRALAQGYTWSHTGFDPQSLQISTVDLVPNAQAGVDALTELTNPNPSWLARARVSFVSDRGKSAMQEVTVLPGKRQPVVAIGLTAGGISASVTALVEAVAWVRLPDIETSLSTSSSGILLQNAHSDSNGRSSIIHITLVNATPHHYRDLQLVLRWYEGTRLMGFKVFPVEQLQSRERVTIDLNTPSLIASYARFQLDPLFDLTDPEHFFTPGLAPRNALP